MKNYVFYTNTPLANGVKELFSKLEEHLNLDKTIRVYLAGGIAVHLYTGNRVTSDVDAEFSSRIFIPRDLVVKINNDGKQDLLYFDTNYNSTFALMHEDYLENSIHVENFGTQHIQLFVLSPVDLAVSKIARFADNDKEDIISLTQSGLITSSEVEERATGALSGFIGGLTMLKLNLQDTVNLIKDVESTIELDNNAEISSYYRI